MRCRQRMVQPVPAII
ncbi:TPA: hypothetical protein N0F65_010336 [Lagenidium giganteum]|uniref:Uncharacterized protein n=1 Tax=Lagenidium giganteum TaxID=4803 RepID=A0AAV2ZAN1_9STRA|nr:TPA: hypothetical protein N0F65_010336 [Lagenidium giganteum]